MLLRARIAGFHVAADYDFLVAIVAFARLGDLFVFVELKFPAHLVVAPLAQQSEGDFFLDVQGQSVELDLEGCLVFVFGGSLFPAVVH